MIVTRENERLYLNNWGYNAARTLTELAELITKNGGRVRQLKTAIISNRSIDEQIREKSERLAHLESIEKERPNENPKRTEAIKQYKIDLAELYKNNNDPVKVTHTSYIEFVLDNIHYYFQFDSNPFFDFLYSKAKVNDNKIPVVCSDAFTKDIFTDAFFGVGFLVLIVSQWLNKS